MASSVADVLIPIYNGAATLESAVASIQAQTVRAIRIILIDDGSTDESGAIARRLAASDSRIMLIEQPNRGIVEALNTGLTACTAEFVARHDADDLAYPGRFAMQLEYLRKHPDCPAVGGAVDHLDNDGRLLRNFRYPDPGLADLDSYPQCEPYLPHSFLMARRSVMEEVGRYRHVFLSEDTDLYWRLQERGQLANLPESLGGYRMHPQSISSSSIVNGRIMSVNSQRAGISAMRRRAGRPDIMFEKSWLADYRSARTLSGVISIGSRGLDHGEAARLATATCAKLLELASYRPYQLEHDDCATIRDTLLPVLPRMKLESRRFCMRAMTGTAALLAAQGQIAASFRLVPPRRFPEFAARLAFRTALPPRVRRTIQRAVGRLDFVK